MAYQSVSQSSQGADDASIEKDRGQGADDASMEKEHAANTGVGGNHLNTFGRMMLQGSPVESSFSIDGCLSMEQMRLKDEAFYDNIKAGLKWTQLAAKIRTPVQHSHKDFCLLLHCDY